MNKAMQIKDTENSLEKIPGNSIQSNKKWKITFAASSNVTGFMKTDHNVTFCISRNTVLKH